MMERLKECRWVYILLSLLLALVFWMYIRSSQNNTMNSTIYAVPVQVTNARVLNERGLTVADLSRDTVNVSVTAPVSVLGNLNRNNITVSVDVASITEPGTYELPCTPRLPTNVNTEGAFFPADQPTQIVTVTVDTLTTETMNVEVRLEGSIADGYQAGTPVADPETVTISGTPEAVNRVRRVVAVLEATDLDQSFAGSLPLRQRDHRHQRDPQPGHRLCDYDGGRGKDRGPDGQPDPRRRRHGGQRDGDGGHPAQHHHRGGHPGGAVRPHRDLPGQH